MVNKYCQNNDWCYEFYDEVDKLLHAYLQGVLICDFIVEAFFTHLPCHKYDDEQSTYWKQEVCRELIHKVEECHISECEYRTVSET